MRKHLLFGILFICQSYLVSAQKIIGNVSTKDGKALQGVVVSSGARGHNALTDSVGRFTFTVTPGWYKISFFFLYAAT